jgi:hypothetical protein
MRATRPDLAVALLALTLLAGCATPPACPAGTQQATVAEAYFGRSLAAGGEITEAQWAGFLAEVVTPAFPDGLTALDGAGQWRAPDGRLLRERSKLLQVVLPGEDAAAARARLAPVEAAWKARFAQQSVLTAYRSACVGF